MRYKPINFNSMQFQKITLIAAIVLITNYSCKNNTHYRDHDTYFKWPEGKKMGLSLTFDDARLTQIDKGVPLFDKYGVKGTFYVSFENMFERTDKWRQAVANGHEVGNHSYIHPCSGNFSFTAGRELENLTLDDIREDLEMAGRVIRDSLGVDAVSFSYPCGQTFVGRGANTKSYVPVVASLFETGRGWLDEAPNDPEFCDMAQLMGMELDGKSFSEIKALIDSAKRTGKWLILVGHEMNDKGEQTSLLTTLEAICKYAMDPANEIWIDNVQNIASYIKQNRSETASTEAATPATTAY